MTLELCVCPWKVPRPGSLEPAVRYQAQHSPLSPLVHPLDSRVLPLAPPHQSIQSVASPNHTLTSIPTLPQLRCSLLNAVALGFASPALIAPLEGLTLVTNAIVAPIVLPEQLRRMDMIGEKLETG